MEGWGVEEGVEGYGWGGEERCGHERGEGRGARGPGLQVHLCPSRGRISGAAWGGSGGVSGALSRLRVAARDLVIPRELDLARRAATHHRHAARGTRLGEGQG